MTILNQLKEALTEAMHQERHSVGGSIVGASLSGERLIVADGYANLNTRSRFEADTGWLLGSVTKILTTTMLMKFVERGEVDLDEPITRLLPEVEFAARSQLERMTVRSLVNHTNGIDADDFMPSAVRGRDASRFYVDRLPRLPTLFDPGACVHYSNPGFVLAARIVEKITDHPFEMAIHDEILAPAGMDSATAFQTQAILRSTAVGAFAHSSDGTLRAAPVFSLPESGAGAGSTLVVSAADMLTFGELHLRGGIAPNGRRILSNEHAELMRSSTFDLGLPQTPPIGLGWWLVPTGRTTAAWHGGGSPGGTSSFCILPEFDAAITSFATGPGSQRLNDKLQSVVIEALTGQAMVTPKHVTAHVLPDATGEYQSFQVRAKVRQDSSGIEVTDLFEAHDADHARTFQSYSGATDTSKTSRYSRVADGLYASAKSDNATIDGFFGRQGLLTPLAADSGRPAGLHRSLRFTPTVDGQSGCRPVAP